METVFLIVEYIGMISFAISATLIAVDKRADFVGAVVFALLTSFGGGIIRDVILGQTPRVFSQLEYRIMAFACVLVSVVLFGLCFTESIRTKISSMRHGIVLELTDAIGLAVYSVFGAEVAIQTGVTVPTLTIFCGCITGVGGGVLRDICSAEIPFVFRKRVYLVPSILGATLLTLTYEHIPPIVSILISIALIVIIRLLAYYFEWDFPTPLGREEKNEKKEKERINK